MYQSVSEITEQPDQSLHQRARPACWKMHAPALLQGQEHTRIFKDMKTDPVVLGHEVSMTVVQVGENLRDEYRVGQRFIIQADVYKDGVNYAYGYMIQGGLSEYAVIDLRIAQESGLKMVEALHALDENTRIVMLTGYASVATAVEAIKLGAVHYLTKPADADEILAALDANLP